MSWLRPLSPVFGLAVSVRNAFFDTGLFSGPTYRVKIVSVGNLSVGGTGKTPVTAHLITHLRKLGKRVSVVSRGYGGEYTEEALRVQPDIPQAARIFGDEPVLLAKGLNVPVFVGRRRRTAVEKCLAEEKTDVIVADDAFQHRWLRRDVDIVLLDAQETFMDLLPSGRFREPLSSLRRAHYVFLTKTNFLELSQLEDWMKRLEPYGFAFHKANLFRAPYALGKLEPQNGAPPLQEGESVILASAIAKPSFFEDMIHPRQAVQEHLIRADHHQWAPADIAQLQLMAKKHKTDAVVVTEKDFVKIKNLNWGALRLYVAQLSIELEPEFPYADLIK